MRTSNLANQALRDADVGHVWEERLSGAAGTLSLKPYQTFRVRAASGTVTVTIDGTLAMTLGNGEIALFNAGSGVPGASPADQQAISVSVVVIGNAYLQIARDNVRQN